MKKLFVFAAFFFVVTISSSALAANWIHVTTDHYPEHDVKFYVDKDSVQRGIYSKNYSFSRSDGFSAYVRREYDSELEDGYYLMGFWTEDGRRIFANLDHFDKDGNLLPGLGIVYVFDADGGYGDVYDYLQDNLP